MTSQFADITSSSSFFDVISFLLSSLVTGIDHKSRNRKYPCLSFAQYLETGASWLYQIWHNEMLLKCYWILQDVRSYSFYRFWVIKLEPKGGGGLPAPHTQIRVKLTKKIIIKSVNVLSKISSLMIG